MSQPYPKVQEKIITLNKWHRGMSDIDLDEYSLPGHASYVQNADLIEAQPYLRPNWVSTDDSSGLTGTGLTGRVRGYALAFQSLSSVTQANKDTIIQPRIYAVDYGTAVGGGGAERIGVYSKENWTETWATVDQDESASITSSEPTAGCEFYSNNLLYFASSYTNERFMGECNISGVTIDPLWDDIDTAAWGGDEGVLKGFLKHSDGNLFILKGVSNQGYLGLYDGTTKPSLTTPASTPAGFEPVDMISYGNKLLVLVNSAVGGSSKLLIRDPYQNIIYTFDDIYDIDIFRAQVIRVVKGRVIILSFDYDIKIWEWTGGDNVNLLKILEVGTYSTGGQSYIRPECVDTKDGILYFGTCTDLSTFNNGIYAFGFNDDGTTFLYNVLADQNNDLSDIRWRAMKWYDDSISTGVIATGYDVDASAYRNIRYVVGGTRSGNLDWRSVWMRPFPGLKSQIIKCSIYHDSVSSATIAVSQDTDTVDPITWGAGNLRFTASTTSSFFTQVGANQTLRGSTTGTNTAFTSGRKHKIRITMSSGAKLEKVKLRLRSTEQE